MYFEHFKIFIMEILNHPTVSINYDEAQDYLIIVWNKFPRSEFLRDIYSRVSSRMEGKSSKHWIIDKKHIKVIAPEDQIWMSNEWASKLNKNLRLAFIDSIDIFGQLSVRNVVKSIKDNQKQIQLEIFKNEEEAIKWFHSSNAQ